MNKEKQTIKILSFFILLSTLLLTSSCTKTSLYPHDALAPPNSDYATVHILREWALTHSLNTLPIKFNGANLLKIKNSSYTTVRIKPDTYEVIADFHSTKPHTSTSTETYRTSHETSYGTSHNNKIKKSKRNKPSIKSANKNSIAKQANSNRQSPNQNSVEKRANSKDKQANSKFRNTGAAKKHKKNKTTKKSETKITTGNKKADYIIKNRKGYRGKDRHTHEETYTTTTTTTYGTGAIEVEMIAGEVYYILVRADTDPEGGDMFVSTSINLLDKTLGEEMREELKFIAAKQEK